MKCLDDGQNYHFCLSLLLAHSMVKIWKSSHDCLKEAKGSQKCGNQCAYWRIAVVQGKRLLKSRRGSGQLNTRREVSTWVTTESVAPDEAEARSQEAGTVNALIQQGQIPTPKDSDEINCASTKAINSQHRDPRPPQPRMWSWVKFLLHSADIRKGK